MALQDYIALTLVVLISGSLFYKMFFAKKKIATCSQCKKCPAQTSLSSVSSCS